MVTENSGEQEPAQSQCEILNRLADYCKYLYEEEKQRTERLERKVNVFTVALGGGFVAVLLKLPSERIFSFTDFSQPTALVVCIPFAISLLLFLLSSFYTFLVYKVRKFERLSNPKEMARKAQSMTDEAEFLSALIADYTVATNKNHDINENKARHLSYALLCLLGALLFIIISVLLFNTILPYKGTTNG